MYHPEPYWNKVARHIGQREVGTLLAGDNEPYYTYKRNKFLAVFHKIQFRGKKVLEIGSGPGGNLLEVLDHMPAEVHGVDISDEMIALAKENLAGKPVTITKIDGQQIPCVDHYFDISFTSTVLQHNTDEMMLVTLINEMCRVTESDIYIFERIESSVKGDELCMGRPVSYYQSFFAANGFDLAQTVFLDLQASYLVSGSIRKLFNSSKRKEGEPPTIIASLLQRITLPLTSVLDTFIPVKRDLAMLHFKRRNSTSFK